MKRKRNITIMLGVIVLLVIAIIVLGINKVNKEKDNKDDADNTSVSSEVISDVQEDIMDKVENVFASSSTTMDNIKKVMGHSVLDSLLVTGDDAYIRTTLSDSLIKKYKLEEYVSRQKQYADRIEKEYLDSLKVTLGETQTVDNQVHQQIKIISFYYGMYIGDLNELQSSLFLKMGYEEIPDIDTNAEAQVAYYKAKVDAMKILDDHFENYVNHEEEHEVTIVYENGKPQSTSETFTLLCNLSGITYPNASFADEEVANAQRERLNQYLEE